MVAPAPYQRYKFTDSIQVILNIPEQTESVKVTVYVDGNSTPIFTSDEISSITEDTILVTILVIFISPFFSIVFSIFLVCTINKILLD